MDRLAKMRVVVVGCGGIGVGTSFLLAGMGVRRFVLIDGDDIEASNLNRQFLYSLEDVGQPKVEVLARELRRRFPEASFETKRSAIVENDGYLRRLVHDDVVIVSADDPPDLFVRVRASLARGIRLWTAGYLFGVSRVMVVGRQEESVPCQEWFRVGPVSTSVGFQNFDVCSRLAFAIAADLPDAYFFDYRDALPR